VDDGEDPGAAAQDAEEDPGAEGDGGTEQAS
jgi:hypothetical protein